MSFLLAVVAPCETQESIFEAIDETGNGMITEERLNQILETLGSSAFDRANRRDVFFGWYGFARFVVIRMFDLSLSIGPP